MNTIEVIFLTSSVLSWATGLLILAINPRRTINQAYAITQSLTGLWLFCIYMAIHVGLTSERRDLLLWLKTCNAFASFLPWSYGLLKNAITEPGSLAQIIRRSWPRFIAGCTLAALTFTVLYTPDSNLSEPQKNGIAYAVYLGAFSILCISILADACKRMRNCAGVRLLEIKFFVINICLTTLVILATLVASHLSGILALRHSVSFVIVASFGLTVWAICYHRVFDARQVFAALGRRLSTLVVLAICILITHLYLSRVLSDVLSLLTGVGIAALVAEYWDYKVCNWLGLDPKRILASPRAQIIEWAREEADASKLIARFETFLRDWCQTEFVTIHTIESHESPNEVMGTRDCSRTFPLLCQIGYITPETLARMRPDIRNRASAALLTKRNLGALIAVPRGSHSPSCVVAFGHKHSLRPYTYPDIQLLIELVELMDNILTQARVAARTAQIEKMESAAMMSRGLAHDLSNLATPVSSFLLHMEDRVKPGSPEAEVLADAKHSIRVMQDYIRESLFFARRLVPNFQPVAAGELLTSTVKLTQSRAQARQVDVIIGKETHVGFTADRALLLRLLQNLVFNGIDATPRGGRVTLSVAAVDHERISFCITDEGSGVPAKIMDRIFEPYFTTKDTGDEVRGLGLGLAICLKISGLHGGDIHVGNTASGGAIFTVCLPLTPKHINDASSPRRESTPIIAARASLPVAENPAT